MLMTRNDILCVFAFQQYVENSVVVIRSVYAFAVYAEALFFESVFPTDSFVAVAERYFTYVSRLSFRRFKECFPVAVKRYVNYQR